MMVGGQGVSVTAFVILLAVLLGVLALEIWWKKRRRGRRGCELWTSC